MSRIFINYRRQDSEGYVGRLYDRLTTQFDRGDVFMDVDSIKPGADFVAMLEQAVADCDVFIAVIGPHWLKVEDEAGVRRLDNWNDFVRIEITSALKQEKLIIPVLVGGSRMPSPADLPDDLKALTRRNGFELSHQRFAYDVDKLIGTIKESALGDKVHKPETDEDTLKRKDAALRAVERDLLNAKASPLYKVRVDSGNFPVIGAGNPDANILFIGESPGKHEAELGRPFVGPSGDVLAEMLRGINLRREDVYVTNIVLDHPGEKREPTPAEIAFYGPLVDRIMAIVEPKVIATLGRFAMQYILKKLDLPQKQKSISDLHGKPVQAKMPYGDIYVVPMYHPAVVLYSARQKETLRQDFEVLRQFV
ncbi:MAG TPA: uracil-DNA glycosylase family protein [Aggregatilineales bacterium]|nr:uracil-DNA glycosylase family protein [Aggregatilineales bacterium]